MSDKLDKANEKIEELESELIDLRFNIKYNKEIELKQLISEIIESTKDILLQDEFAERNFDGYKKVNFKESIINLNKYIEEYLEDNKIYLK